MLISGGKVIAIDEIKTNSATISGNGIWTELGLNTTATIDPITSNISEISSNVDTISSDLNTVSSNVNSISGDLTEISGKLDIEIQERIDNVSSLSSIIDEHASKIETISSDVITVSAGLDEETSARIEDVLAIEKDINKLSADLDDEIYYREENDNYLSAAIDTKQKQLSAGQYVELVENDDYDTINITGINPSTFFTAQMNRHSSSEYFTFDGHTLSASDKIGYFNLSIGYKVSTTDTNVDNYYESKIKINGTDVDTQYIEGAKPFENHYISQNILNDAANHTYEFLIEKDNGLDISNMNITCIGFIGEANNIDVGVLGTNGAILTFGGNTILRV